MARASCMCSGFVYSGGPDQEQTTFTAWPNAPSSPAEPAPAPGCPPGSSGGGGYPKTRSALLLRRGRGDEFGWAAIAK